MSAPHRLPSLNALRVFWVVMRQGSFRAAATELLISPQAVSQQIRQLEESLGVSLFARRSRAVEPTAQAKTLIPFVNAGFDEFLKGVDQISMAHDRQRIHVNVSPYFASRYLVKKLNRFLELMPQADVRLTNMTQLPNFASDATDISIQWGFDEWPGYETALLVKDPKIICCTPALAAKIPTVHDLCHIPLLYPIHADHMWNAILAHFGESMAHAINKVQFQSAESMRMGTASGLGVGLLSRADAEEEIASGRLVAPFGMDAIADMDEASIPGFYVVMPKSHKRVAIIARFYRWVISETWTLT